MSDPLIGLLAGLQSAQPNPARAERVKARCRARLAKQATRVSPPRDVARGRATMMWQPLIAILGAAYLADVIVTALGVYKLQ
jgi:hypothetical protein